MVTLENEGKMVKSSLQKLKVIVQKLDQFYDIIYGLKLDAGMRIVTFVFNSKNLTILVSNMDEDDRAIGFGDYFNVGDDEYLKLLNCDQEIKFSLALPELDCLMYYGLKTDNTMEFSMFENSDELNIVFPTQSETHILYAR